MNYQKYLPIGSVVLLKDATKKLMITGFCVFTQDNKSVFDYCGCIYPEGMISSEQNCLFNHEQIDKVYHLGFSDDEERKFKDKLREVLSTND